MAHRREATNFKGEPMNADGYYADDAPDEDFDLSFLED